MARLLATLMVLSMSGCGYDRTAEGYLTRLESERESNRLVTLYNEFKLKYPEQADNPALKTRLDALHERLAEFFSSSEVVQYSPWIEEYSAKHPDSTFLPPLLEKVLRAKGAENLEASIVSQVTMPLTLSTRVEIARTLGEEVFDRASAKKCADFVEKILTDFPVSNHWLPLCKVVNRVVTQNPNASYSEILLAVGDFYTVGGENPKLAKALYQRALEENSSLKNDVDYRTLIAETREIAALPGDATTDQMRAKAELIADPVKRQAAILCVDALLDHNHSNTSTSIEEQKEPQKRHVEIISSKASRVAGYPNSVSASAYVETALKDAGAKILPARSFPMTVPVDKGAEIRLEDGVVLPMRCLWPNDVRTPTLPREGVSATLISAGKDIMASLDGRDVSGTFILCDFNSEDEWVRVSSLAPAGFIFIEPENTTRQNAEKKFLSLPLDMPRFWIDRPIGAFLRERAKANGGSLSVMLSARMDWTTAGCRNIIARIDGTDPTLSNEMVVLCSHYDSISVVPSLSPGAESACGIATLIELVRSLAKNPPQRTVLIAALDAHYLCMGGASRFVRDLDDVLTGGVAQREADGRLALTKLRGALTGIADLSKRTTISKDLEWTQKQLNLAISLKETELKDLLGLSSMAAPSSGGEFIELLERRAARLKAIKREFGSTPDLDNLVWKTKGKISQKKVEEDKLPKRERERLRRTRQARNVLIVSLDLTSGSQKVGLFHRSSYEDWRDIYIQRAFSPLARSITQRVNDAAAKRGVDPSTVFADAVNGAKGQSGDSFFQEAFALDCDVLGSAIPTLSLATCNDPRLRVDTPHDLSSAVNFDNLSVQAQTVSDVVSYLVNDKDLKLNVKFTKRLQLPVRARMVTFDPQQSLMPDTPLVGAIASVRPVCFERQMSAGIPGFPKPLYGVHCAFYSQAALDGNVSLEQFAWPHFTFLRSYGLGDDGSIIYANDFGENGDKRYNFSRFHVADRQGSSVTCVLFPCASTSFAGLVDPRYMKELHEVQVFDAVTQAEPLFFGFAQPMSLCYGDSNTEPCLVTFTKPGIRTKISMSLGMFGRKLLVTDASESQPEGIGIENNGSRVFPTISYTVARDLWLLNESRRSVLARHGISSETIDQFHDLASVTLKEADAAKKERKWKTLLTASEKSWAYSSRIYANLLQTSNDTVKCVIFYLALVIPFAYFLERLFFGFADLRKSIAGSVAIFVLVLLILMQVHPAFAISMTPFLIFLAFTILVLGVLVGGIVLRKLAQELERIRGGLTGVEHADVNRFAAAFAAFNLGVSHMRRRKVRTALTCGVLLLLTFTVLSFTSVRNYVKFNRFSLSWPASYQGLLFRNLDWSPFELTQAQALSEDLKEKFIVSPRAWQVSRWPSDFLQMEASTSKGRASFQGIAGLSSAEPQITKIDKTLIAGRWFNDDERDACLLPESSLGPLGIDLEDVKQKSATVEIVGRKLRVVGVFREEGTPDNPGMNDIVDLNGEDDTLMPTTYVFSSEVNVNDFSEGGIEAAAQARFNYLDARSVVILPFQTVLDAGGTVRSVAAVPKDDKKIDLDAFLTQLMMSRSLVAYAGLRVENKQSGETIGIAPGSLKSMLYSSVGSASMQGLKNLAIPIAIAALTILNTLLGSVIEREKEIWTYSSVGLSPIHIACLFIAEACVYGVIGSVGGYLIGQVVGKIVTSKMLAIGSLALANPLFLPGLTLNFSSTSAVASVLLVMLVTLLSSLYPAKRAHELATPEIERRWQLAPPTSEEWLVRMPFIVRTAHVPATNAYLYEFLDLHRQEMVGNFFVDHSRVLVPEKGETFVLEFDCWLAPYDFGVSQRVRLATVPTGDDDLESFRLTLHRKSGDVQSWLRTNRAFLNEMRKALLIWRTMTTEARTHYENEAEKLFSVASASVPTIMT